MIHGLLVRTCLASLSVVVFIRHGEFNSCLVHDVQRSSISFGFIGLPNDAPAIIANISTFSHLRFMDTPSSPDVESPESASECTSPLRVQSCVRQGRRTAAADGFTVLEEVAAKKQEAI